MEEREETKALLSGIIYGDCAFWIALVGMFVGLIGIIIYFFGNNQFFDANILINHLLAGKDADTIWRQATEGEVIYGHWYLNKFGFSDAISMLGISICCCAAVVGAWGSVIGMIVNKEKPYLFLVFALIISVILTCSAAGLISLH
jgi:hypothetical protein